MTTTKERSAGKSADSGWSSDLDRQAVDHVRALAMDAVQSAGDGHPGTAMSLAPAAYLLFQEFLRHDPTDPDWIGRDRFVLVVRALQPDALHPALPFRLRPHARGPEALPAVGQPDPGPPGARPHRRRRGHDRPAGLGGRRVRRHGDGGPARARAVRPRRQGRRERLRPHHLGVRLRRRHGRGRLRGGQQPRRPPAARQSRRPL